MTRTLPNLRGFALNGEAARADRTLGQVFDVRSHTN